MQEFVVDFCLVQGAGDFDLVLLGFPIKSENYGSQA